jgi:hypothetical protein
MRLPLETAIIRLMGAGLARGEETKTSHMAAP